MKLKVILTPSEKGKYVVEVPAIKGILTEGISIDDALYQVKDAIVSVLSDQDWLLRHLEPGQIIKEIEIKDEDL